MLTPIFSAGSSRFWCFGGEGGDVVDGVEFQVFGCRRWKLGVVEGQKYSDDDGMD